MSALLFVLLVGLILFNLGIQAYIHFEAYPLLTFVGKAEFGKYLSEYEGRLTIPLLVPYGLTMLCNLLLIFFAPAGVSVLTIIVLLVLNGAVAGVTMQLATPIYNKVKSAGQADAATMAELMTVNLYRLGLSGAAALIVLVALFGALPR